MIQLLGLLSGTQLSSWHINSASWVVPHNACSVHVCWMSTCCVPRSHGHGGCCGVGTLADPGPSEPPSRTCAPSFLPGNPSPAVPGRKDGPPDIHLINCFLSVHLGCPSPSPLNSKQTFKNEQAISGNNIHDIQ